MINGVLHGYPTRLLSDEFTVRGATYYDVALPLGQGGIKLTHVEGAGGHWLSGLTLTPTDRNPTEPYPRRENNGGVFRRLRREPHERGRGGAYE